MKKICRSLALMLAMIMIIQTTVTAFAETGGNSGFHLNTPSSAEATPSEAEGSEIGLSREMEEIIVTAGADDRVIWGTWDRIKAKIRMCRGVEYVLRFSNRYNNAVDWYWYKYNEYGAVADQGYMNVSGINCGNMLQYMSVTTANNTLFGRLVTFSSTGEYVIRAREYDGDGNAYYVYFHLEVGYHEIGETVQTITEPTCTEYGEEYRDCMYCHTQQFRLTPAPLGHSLDKGTITREATSTKEGILTYKCTRSGCTYTETKTIPKIKTVPITGIKLNLTAFSMNIGNTVALTASVTPKNASEKSVSWKSSNTSVATVTSNGMVTGKAPGSAIITATTKDGKKTAKCTVTVNKRKATITAGNKSVTASASKSQTVKLGAKVNSGGKLTYKSNVSSVKVSSSGEVTIPKNYTGKITITISAAEKGNYDSAVKKIMVTVNKAAATITAANKTVTASASKSQTVKLGTMVNSGGKLTYKSNVSDVKVSSTGEVMIPKNYTGKVTITITAAAKGIYDAAVKKITVTVNKVTATISASNKSLKAGTKAQTVKLGAKVNSGGKLTYKSNVSGVKVNSTGVVTIPKNYTGKVTITITAAAKGIYSSVTKKITITVER